MMLRVTRTLLISLVLLTWFGTIPQSARAISPEELVTEIQKKYTDLTSLSADYTRTTHTAAMEGVFHPARNRRPPAC